MADPTAVELAGFAEVQQVMAWAKSGMGLSIGQNIETKISERPDKNYSVQCYAQMSLGCVRVQDNHVVEIACT